MKLIEYTIGALALEIKTGKTPSTSNPLYYGDGYNWLTPGDLSGKKIIEKSDRRITNFAVEKKEAVLFEPKTILISTIGEIGKACIVDRLSSSNQQLTGVRVDESIILPELFYYWVLRSKKLLENKSNRAVIPILNNKLLKKIKVSFPEDHKEQYKIVAQINKIQDLIDKRVKTIELLDQYIRSVFLEIFGDPLLNNKKYPYDKLEKIVINEKISYGVVKSGDDAINGIPFVRTIDLKENYVKIENLKLISNQISEQYSRTKLTGKELLISVRGNIGLVGLVSEELKGANVSRGIVPLLFKDEKERIFYFYYFSDKNFNLFFNRLSKGIALKQVNISELKKLKVFDLSSEKDSLNKFYDISLIIQSKKEKCQKSLELLETMFQSTLQNSFCEKSKINEENIFEDIIQDLTIEDFNKGERIQFLINCLNKEKLKFTSLEKYNIAVEKLFELLEKDNIEQYLDDIKIKLRSNL